MLIRAAPELGVIEVHRVEQSRPAVGGRGIQQPGQSDGKGDAEPPCQDEAIEAAERSPGYSYGLFFSFFHFTRFCRNALCSFVFVHQERFERQAPHIDRHRLNTHLNIGLTIFMRTQHLKSESAIMGQ
ncbi:uncharacterized protein LACBIDRAFT_335141 [Laccaria bicolor S238N-H82]|uniref:Predicted protein n=1 Tax=Laccaria bicolor (strain S238N-H82 / ATCC MYA-4686) TaxID=486041 RepID=B0E1H8_LACBS|nr:uncharacterized protein LACBIDRAFT_335141 [Laccaria bicolor S238N-H82]EDQ99330.1 predicted protein [Laccaria bicolor S238N-H82]|eukprot:XP_001890050.1 predicted protein [Laccaria bicolor S238N-H82]